MYWQKWFPEPVNVYVSPEIFIDECLWSTTGGLGIVGHSFLRSARSLNLPSAGLTIRWRYGSYVQKVGPNGMEHDYAKHEINEKVIDTGIKVKVQLAGNPNVLLSVKLIPSGAFETVPCICLDADVEGNDGLSRSNTEKQYPGYNRGKLAQMIILGVGGVRAFRALGIPVRKWHLNEGFSVLAAAELIREKKAAGLSFQEALSQVKQEVVFTTHMPGMPGSEVYNRAEMMEMGCFPGLEESEVSWLGRIPSDLGQFHVTAASLRIAGKVNAVSQLHAKTTEQVYSWVQDRPQAFPITNGVDVNFWQWPEFAQARTPEALKAAKMGHKTIFAGQIQSHYAVRGVSKIFDPKVLTMGWGRRLDEYKRPWIAEGLGCNGFQVQTACSGKPNLTDGPMISTWNRIWDKSKAIEKLAILPEDGYRTKMQMKAGVDLWLLSSRRPREACEDCFMSAMMNGALVMATFDGGPLEINPSHRFLYGVQDVPPNIEEQDCKDFEDAKRVLPEVIRLFRDQPDVWWQKALEAKEEAEEKFSGERMVREYADKLYI
ncbi:MAG: hypothetical protein Q7S70_02740 [bacterium]|nr:hypothetical protein [bacterium]